jgi:aldose sugar dehydrogenase
MLSIIVIIFFLLTMIFVYFSIMPVYSLKQKYNGSANGPNITDTRLKAEVVFKGTNFFTSMAFLGPDDILVLEKNTGKVQRIVNGKILNPLFDANVATEYERGMIGIALAKDDTQNQKENKSSSTYVFLFYTESKEDSDDECPYPNYCVDEGTLLGNRLYRYELVNNSLVNPRLLLDLPSSPMPVHIGGKISIGPDNHVYLMTGDGSFGNTSVSDQKILYSKSSNAQNGSDPIGRGGILRVTQDGKIVGQGILGNKYPLNLYYAYGIRSSFGMDFDPVTGNLWDTENGPIYGDEINLVKPGFNSGWNNVQGIWKNKVFINGQTVRNPDNLVDFGGKGNYSSPEFTWYRPSVSPTALKFLNSDKLGKEYENDIFVGDYHKGNIYDFDLNEKRTDFVLRGPLKDKIADTLNELKSVVFGQGFGGITDMQVGPDGYLYVLSNYESSGDYKKSISVIYRIVRVKD